MRELLITKKEFAERIGVTQGMVTGYCKRGLPLRDGKVRYTVARQWIKDNGLAQRQKTAGRKGKQQKPQPVKQAAKRAAKRVVKKVARGAAKRVAKRVVTKPVAAVSSKLAVDVETRAEATRRKEVALADLRELELGEKRGELVEVAAMRPIWATVAQTVRDNLLGLPSRLAPILAATVDKREIRLLLESEFRQILTALPDAIETKLKAKR